MATKMGSTTGEECVGKAEEAADPDPEGELEGVAGIVKVENDVPLRTVVNEFEAGIVRVVEETGGVVRVVEIVPLEDEVDSVTDAVLEVDDVVDFGVDEVEIVELGVDDTEDDEVECEIVMVVEIELGGALATLDGTETDEVSLGTGEEKEPDMLSNLKFGEYSLNDAPATGLTDINLM